MSRIPDYQVRESTKAKSVRLEVSVRHGLVVVVPEGFEASQIHALIVRKRAWIEKAFRKVLQRGGHVEPGPAGQLPQHIPLQAIGEEWTIQNQRTEARWVTAVGRSDDTILVRGNIEDTAVYLGALRRWITRKAHGHLSPWLQQLSEDEGLPFGRTLVKSQRTRWASCSWHKTISINQNLLFLPAYLVRYIFIHELCHTIHLNHSRKFWALVGHKEPGYSALRKELHDAWRWVPAWIEDSPEPHAY
ncbi:MAG: DUF45 domain-containing protein [Chloroflexi bacterium]|nr:DUF45 domain-containing protein [Chloroflexota bacterium]